MNTFATSYPGAPGPAGSSGGSGPQPGQPNQRPQAPGRPAGGPPPGYRDSTYQEAGPSTYRGESVFEDTAVGGASTYEAEEPAAGGSGSGAPQRTVLSSGGAGGRRVSPLRAGVLAAVLLAVVGGGAWLARSQGWWPGGSDSAAAGASSLVGGPAASGPAAAAALAAMSQAERLRVVATVNGKTIVQEELAGLLAAGVDRAVAVDRYINKVLAADAARDRFADESRAMLAAAEREVLANLYLQRRAQELLTAVTDAQITEYYNANVRDEDYASFRLRYYLTRDQADAANVRGLLDRADKAAQGKLAALAPANGAGDGWLGFQAIPYGLGRVVRSAKPGEIIGPVLVRDGLLILVLDERREGKKPALDTVKEEIRAVLADRQLGDELLGLRKKAQIQLQ